MNIITVYYVNRPPAAFSVVMLEGIAHTVTVTVIATFCCLAVVGNPVEGHPDCDESPSYPVDFSLAFSIHTNWPFFNCLSFIHCQVGPIKELHSSAKKKRLCTSPF